MRTRIQAGIVAGLLAALAYGIVLQLVTTPAGGMSMTTNGEDMSPMDGMKTTMAEGREPMILMVARMARSDSILVAWALLLAAGAGMGALFAALIGRRRPGPAGGVSWAVAYAALWWVAATLVVMPLALGAPPFAPITDPAMRAGAFIGLAAYVLAGIVLGGAFVFLCREPPRSG